MNRECQLRRETECLLRRFVLAQRERQELADMRLDPDARVEAYELEDVGDSAITHVLAGRW